MIVETYDKKPRCAPGTRVVAVTLLDVPAAPPCARDFMTAPRGVKLKAVIAAEANDRGGWRWADLTPAEKSALGATLEREGVAPGDWRWCRIL